MRIIATFLISLFAAFSVTPRNGPDVIADFQRLGPTPTSSGDMSSQILDLESPNDPEAEFDGAISNDGKSITIRGIRFWFEAIDGTSIPELGASPITALASGPDDGPFESAHCVSNRSGIAVYELAGAGIAPGGHVAYEAQVDSFKEPLNYRNMMSFSGMHASKAGGAADHYDLLGDQTFATGNADCIILDGLAPTIHSGVAFTATNGDDGRPLKGLKVTLLSNLETLKFKSGDVESATLESISGATTALSNADRTITFSNLAVEERSLVVLWLKLNSSYDAETVFKAQAIY